jgi:predicted O-methyltransferase YrrM/ketosteroid isomerase-like protein
VPPSAIRNGPDGVERLSKIPSTLRSPVISQILDRLHAQAEREDPLAKQRVQAREAELGERLRQERRYELYGEAPLAITREVGRLLYVLTRTRRARRVVEFGCSLGISTIYLAAAIRDGGDTGEVITTELLPEKISAARDNLVEAGLGDLVQWREGDALETLRQLPEGVDLLFLDGRNDLYLSVLELVEPKLAPAALLVADLNTEDPDLHAFLDYVRDPDNGYSSVEIPLADGVEVSVRSAAGRRYLDLVAELHRRQGEMYAGGSIDPVLELLSPDIIWHVPGKSPIAGDHRGAKQVIDYFERRRQLANATMRMHPGETISEGDAVAQFVEGTAVLDGEQVSWQTIGIYRVDVGHSWIREVWLVPLDGELFDRIWSDGGQTDSARGRS